MWLFFFFSFFFSSHVCLCSYLIREEVKENWAKEQISRTRAAGGKRNLTICMTSKANENSGYAIFKQILAIPHGFLGVYVRLPKTEGQL